MGTHKPLSMPIFYIVCFISLVLTCFAFILSLNSPAQGYEVSIYTSTPSKIWVIIGVNIVISIVLLVNEARIKSQSKRWLWALGILILNNSIVLLMSVLRGYFAVGSDTLMHIGYVRDLANGIISPLNIYPLLHLIPAFFVKLGMTPSLATNLSPLYWYLIYISSFYCLAKIAFKENIILVVTLSALLFIPHSAGLAGTNVAVSVFPLTIVATMIVCRNFNLINIIIFILFIVYVLFLHPLALEVAFIALFLSLFIVGSYRKNVFILIGSLVIVVTVWQVFTRGDIISEVVNDLWASLGRIKFPSLNGVQLAQTNGEYSSIMLLLRKYGGELLLGSLAFVSLIVMAVKYRSLTRYKLYFIIIFVAVNLMWIAGWLLHLPRYNFALIRIMYWAVPTSIIVVSLILKHLPKNILTMLLLIIIILPMALFGIFNRYLSEFVGAENTQVTQQQIQGIKFLVEIGNPETYIVHLNGQRTSRYVASLYGAEWTRKNRGYYWVQKMEGWNNFNYNKYKTLGDAYDEDIYLVVTKQDKTLPRWENDKLYKINNDPTATLLYKDGEEFEAWFVNGDGK